MPGTELFGEEERKEVMDVLATGALFRYGHEALRQGHWKAREFEAEVRRYTGASHAHAVSSGSAAVACTLAGAGIGHGDEVIVPPFTFIATIEAALFAGALPVFAEIDESLCLSVEGVRQAITPRTKAVLLVHMCGAAADLDGLVELCREHNLILVEDAGQALGAFHNGQSVGRFGAAGAFSFDYFKITTCGEGGVVITDDDETAKTMEYFSDHGHTHVGNNRGMEPHPILGFNYRLSELHAAVGLAQMRKLPLIRERKLAHKARLKSRTSKMSGVTFRRLFDPKGDSGTFLNFFLPSAAAAERAVALCEEHGVPGATYWFTNRYHFINQWEHVKRLSTPGRLPIHELGPPQHYDALALPRSQDVMSRLVSLGIRYSWRDDELEQIADGLLRVLEVVLE